MKTQIITLESHDDLISVRDRLSWAKTPRVLLVWPRYVEATLRPLDLKVLQRQADSLGAQLGLVTRRESVRREAEALTIPVFESTAAAQKDAWPVRNEKSQRVARPPRRDLRKLREQAIPVEAEWRSKTPIRVIMFSLGVLAVLLVTGLFVPRAAISLRPESQAQDIVIPVVASQSVKSVFVTGSVPSRLEKVVVAGSKTIPIIGRITIPQTRARGVVRFENLTETEVAIPAGTVVLTMGDSPVRFGTMNATRITAGVGQFVEVPAEAVEAGSSGNLPANALQAVEGVLGLSATVTNPEPTDGGSDRTAIGASDADREQLRQGLLDDLTSQAEVNLQSRVAHGNLLLLDTLTVSQTLEEAYNPPLNQPGTSLSLNLRLEFAIQVVSTEDLDRLAQAALDAAVPQGFQPATDPLTYESITAPVTDRDGTTRWQMKARRRLIRKVDTTQVLNIVRGRTPDSAGTALMKALTLEGAPIIRITPDWWPWLPLIPFRISVVTQ